MLYEKNAIFRDEYQNILNLSHPFEFINKKVKSRLIEHPINDLYITNAFMKMYECLMFIYKYYRANFEQLFEVKLKCVSSKCISSKQSTSIDKTSKHISHLDKTSIDKTFNDKTSHQSSHKHITLYDIASAPGMFIIAFDKFLENYYPNVELNWHASSSDTSTSLQDIYGLYQQNPSKYESINVTNIHDIKHVIAKYSNSISFVSGDIGIKHDYMSDIQEYKQLNIQYGQIILALNIIKTNGIMFLKLYTIITNDTQYLIDLLSFYFENVLILKPYTSRIINAESYILCVGRNKKQLSNKISLIKDSYYIYNSPYKYIYQSFENSRCDARYMIISFLIRLFMKTNENKSLKNKSTKITLNDLKNNDIYNLYIFNDEMKEMYNLLMNVQK